MMVVYMSAQLLGAFIASGLACLVYFDKTDWNMDPVDGTCLLATCAQSDYSNSQVSIYRQDYQLFSGFIRSTSGQTSV